MALGAGLRKLTCWANAQNKNNCATDLNTENHKLSVIKTFPHPVKNILTIKNTKDIFIKLFSITGSLFKKLTSKSDIEIDFS
jgi:hypothetical protein